MKSLLGFGLIIGLATACDNPSAVVKPQSKSGAEADAVGNDGTGDEPDASRAESDSPNGASDTDNTAAKPPVVVLPVSPSTDPNKKLEIAVKGRQLLVDGKPFTIKGVCYNPVRKGQDQGNGLLYNNPTADDLKNLEADFKLMQAAGVNTIRTYSVIKDGKVLALLNQYQLFVIVPALNYFGTTPAQVEAVITALKDHRSTLMWEVGNEWNYNCLYGSAGYDATKAQIIKTGALIKSLDKTHPLSTDHGELPTAALVSEMSDFDVWGLNVYAGRTFGDRLAQWKTRSTKPMYFGEFGADAVNKTVIDEASQAVATEALIKEIRANLSAKATDNVALGGSIFEWNDEWWKDGAGKADVHDIGGIAPGGGPYPDSTFNEEWWGIVDIDRNPRPAYAKLKEQYLLP